MQIRKAAYRMKLLASPIDRERAPYMYYQRQHHRRSVLWQVVRWYERVEIL